MPGVGVSPSEGIHSRIANGNSTVMQVPCPSVLSTVVLPPSNLARSRIPAKPKRSSSKSPGDKTYPPVLNPDPKIIAMLYQFHSNFLALAMRAGVRESLLDNAVNRIF